MTSTVVEVTRVEGVVEVTRGDGIEMVRGGSDLFLSGTIGYHAEFRKIPLSYDRQLMKKDPVIKGLNRINTGRVAIFHASV